MFLTDESRHQPNLKAEFILCQQDQQQLPSQSSQAHKKAQARKPKNEQL
jgi:hypothetical protein